MLDPCHLSGGAVSNSDLILDKFKLRSTFRERGKCFSQQTLSKLVSNKVQMLQI